MSDRRVIDGQLQDALFDFQRTTGVVETIKSESGSKSAQLADALKAGKKIIVCTIQTFPFALQAVRDLAATDGKRFAVIADEAHSSQTGEAAAKLKEVLSPEEIAELQDGGEIDTEDLLAAQMAARASDTGVTYVAFTATPKAKTLQLFGRVKQPGGLPEPFHVYSMRQAIEEGWCIVCQGSSRCRLRLGPSLHRGRRQAHPSFRFRADPVRTWGVGLVHAFVDAAGAPGSRT